MQVEKERDLGLTPSPFMAELDQPVKRYKSQVFFLDIILKPFWLLLAHLFPDLESCVKQLERNRFQYEKLLNKYIAPEELKEEFKKEVKVILAPRRKKKKRKPNLDQSGSLDSLWNKFSVINNQTSTRAKIARSQTDYSI